VCKDCLTEYLKDKFTQGISCVSATCHFESCNLIVPDVLYQQLLPFDMFTRYQHYCTLAYVDFSPEKQWCPNAGCKMVVEKIDKTVGEIDCISCG
jgi:hypothetical protein